MSESLLQFLSIAIVTSLFLAFMAWRFMRWLKGSVSIDLDGRNFSPGEVIAGHCRVSARKLIEGRRLVVALVGEEVSEAPRSRGHRGVSVRRRRREIYRNEVIALGERHFAPASTEHHAFQLPFPEAMPDVFGADGVLARGREIGLSLMSGTRRSIRWRITARLESRGVDLTASRPIRLN